MHSASAHKAASQADVDEWTPAEQEIQRLEEFELQTAKQLGMNAEADSAEVLLKTKINVLCSAYDPSVLRKLHKLHRLRLQYSLTQLTLPVELEAWPLPPGPSHLVDAS
ncbi:uncharacterized protein ARMOST_21455 [Armillaria ostoyae]|uniref:Uncharacterized protein n=1 Tax=Armillaria ostoyae TaxID=47428 RepID=A0A284SA42_ARMOS|nr:uncharacterized protein ARMOST_21455 [Armillaria ostoyae]